MVVGVVGAMGAVCMRVGIAAGTEAVEEERVLVEGMLAREGPHGRLLGADLVAATAVSIAHFLSSSKQKCYSTYPHFR